MWNFIERLGARAAMVMCLLVVSAGGRALAAPGNIDASFGSGGIVTARFADPLGRGILLSSFARAVAVQNDGKIVVAGAVGEDHGLAFGLARFLSTGVLDASFGTGGRTSTDFADFRNDSASGIVLQADGKIVVAGTADAQSGSTSGNFALVRYNANGSLDTTFTSTGKVVTDLGGNDRASAVALQADGKIVVAGSSGGNFALVRYNTNGTLDTTFDTDGKLTTDFGAADVANAVAIQADGKIVAAGSTTIAPELGLQFALARYNTNGSLDTTFGASGKLVGTYVCCTGSSAANAVAIQADGKIVIAGSLGTEIAVKRFTAAGAVDATFFDSGAAHTQVTPSGRDTATSIAIQEDDKVVVAGSGTDSAGTKSIVMVRYKTNGALDNTVQLGGKVKTFVSTPIAGCTSDEALAVALQKNNGRIVVAGSTSLPCAGVGPSIAIVRYHAYVCNGGNATLVGTRGPDTLNGSVLFDSRRLVFIPQPDVILGLGGNDVINGGGGDDFICAGDGNDTLNGGDGTDVLLGETGDDAFTGGNGSDICIGSATSHNTFSTCESIGGGGSGFSGEWIDASDQCNRSSRNLKCQIRAALDVTNPGTEATLVPASIAFYLSSDGVWDENDPLLTSVQIESLDAGETRTVPLHLRLPAGLDPSGQSIIAVLDILEAVAERNEENNVVVSSPLP